MVDEVIPRRVDYPDGHLYLPFRSMHWGEEAALPTAWGDRARTAWDDWDDGAALEYNGVPRENQEIYFRAKMEHHNLLDVTRDWNPFDNGGSVMYLFTRQQDVEELLQSGILGVAQSLEGGRWFHSDDSVFDYFPDVFPILDQLVVSLQSAPGREALELIRQDAVNRLPIYYEDPDLVGGSEINQQIRDNLVKRQYLTADGYYTEKGKKWIADGHKFSEMYSPTGTSR